jgi:lysozyme family protein
MPPTPDETKAGYHAMWDAAQVNPAKAAAARGLAKELLANKPHYEAVEAKTGVPWFMVGTLHVRESSASFRRHLHNGDPLTARTVHVPKGRPVQGRPPFTWSESAVDALTLAPHALDKVKDWSVERILFETEKYNGWGYLGKGNSPYLWSWTNQYRGGKYIADHVYSPRAVDPQPGCVAMLKALAEICPEVAERLKYRQPTPPKDVVEAAVKQATRDDKARAAATATASAGAGTLHAATDTPAPGAAQVAHAYVLPLAVAVAAAIAFAALVTIISKSNHIRKVWS